MEDNQKVICGVCSGKGGWEKDVRTPLDDKWNDCPYCDGYGFIDATSEGAIKNEAHIFRYNHYKKLITDLISDSVCTVEEFTTNDMGKTIKLRVVPHNKPKFTQFVEYIVKVGHFSNRINIGLSQKYYFDSKYRKLFFYWEIMLEPNELTDLDGFVDAIKIFEKAM
jgi:hypothetical protein